MNREARSGLLRAAATAIANLTPGELDEFWNITAEFVASRDRVLPGEHRKPAETYLHLLWALSEVATTEARPELFDSALLSVCLADIVGMDNVEDLELEKAVVRLFSPPLAKPGALEAFEDRIRELHVIRVASGPQPNDSDPKKD